MSEIVKMLAAEGETVAKAGSSQPSGQRPTGKPVSDPREVATLVMARMNAVANKKDELTIAIKGLSDVAQQLALAYAEQAHAIERLSKRVQTLEAAAGAGGGVCGKGAAPPLAAAN